MNSGSGILDAVLVLVVLAVVEVIDVAEILKIILLASAIVWIWIRVYYMIKNKGK